MDKFVNRIHARFYTRQMKVVIIHHQQLMRRHRQQQVGNVPRRSENMTKITCSMDLLKVLLTLADSNV